MKYQFVIRITLIFAFSISMIASAGCDSYGGAAVYLENVNIGSVSVAGKPVTGLPTQKVNIVLKTNASKLIISQASGNTTIKLLPSEAVIVSGADGISFTGVKPEQVAIEWETTTNK